MVFLACKNNGEETEETEYDVTMRKLADSGEEEEVYKNFKQQKVSCKFSNLASDSGEEEE